MSPKPHIYRWLHEEIVPRAGSWPTFSKAGGDQSGLKLGSAMCSNDADNQLTNRTVPGYFEVVGQANPGATVTVNSAATYPRSEHFRKEFAALPEDDDDAGAGCQAFTDGHVAARREPAAGCACAPHKASKTAEGVSIVTTDPLLTMGSADPPKK